MTASIQHSSSVPEVAVPKLKKPQKPKKPRVPKNLPSVGPSSVSPGPWLTRMLVDNAKGSEAHILASEIINSYDFGHRTRVLRYPILLEGQSTQSMFPATNFITKPESIETKSLCYRTVDPAFLTAIEEHGNGFSMLGDSEAISEEYLLEENKDLFQVIQPKAGENQNEDDVDHPTSRPISQLDVMEHYNSWFEEPTEANKTELMAQIYWYFHHQGAKSRSPDSRKLYERGLELEWICDLVDSVLRSMAVKAATGVMILKLENYLNRAFRRRRISVLEKLSREDQQFPSNETRTVTGSSDDEEAVAISKGDLRDYRLSRSNLTYLTEPAGLTTDVRMGRISDLPEELRDYAALRLLGFSNVKIASEQGKSRHAVDRVGKKTAKTLAAIQKAS